MTDGAKYPPPIATTQVRGKERWAVHVKYQERCEITVVTNQSKAEKLARAAILNHCSAVEIERVTMLAFSGSPVDNGYRLV